MPFLAVNFQSSANLGRMSLPCDDGRPNSSVQGLLLEAGIRVQLYEDISEGHLQVQGVVEKRDEENGGWIIAFDSSAISWGSGSFPLPPNYRHERAVFRIAQALLIGDAHAIIEGCRSIQRPLQALGLRNEKDFQIFIDVDSETDRFAVGAEREHWNQEALAKLDVEMKQVTEHYKPLVHTACQKIVERFGTCRSQME